MRGGIVYAFSEAEIYAWRGKKINSEGCTKNGRKNY